MFFFFGSSLKTYHVLCIYIYIWYIELHPRLFFHWSSKIIPNPSSNGPAPLSSVPWSPFPTSPFAPLPGQSDKQVPPLVMPSLKCSKRTTTDNVLKKPGILTQNGNHNVQYIYINIYIYISHDINQNMTLDWLCHLFVVRSINPSYAATLRCHYHSLWMVGSLMKNQSTWAYPISIEFKKNTNHDGTYMTNDYIHT